jgi:hypothetical protein
MTAYEPSQKILLKLDRLKLNSTHCKIFTLVDMRFSQRWKFMSLSSGLWRPEDRRSKCIRNVGILPRHYTASQPRRHWHGIIIINWDQNYIREGTVTSVNVLTRLRAWRPEFDSRLGQGLFSSPPRPDRLWGPPRLLCNGTKCYFTLS